MRKRNPRSVRGARRRGWTVIEPKPTEDASYLGLQIWTDRNDKGKYVSSFMPTKFAFELERDANWFALRWS